MCWRRLGLVTLRPVEAWVGGLGFESVGASDVEAGEGVGRRLGAWGLGRLGLVTLRPVTE